MDKTKLELLGEKRGQDSALELGMEYLQAASRVSTLAARYVRMLKHMETVPSTDASVTKTSHVHQGQEAIPPTPSRASNTAAPSQVAYPQEHALYGALNDVPMFDDPGVIDFNDDLLFGTGLPRDFLTSDWSGFNTPYNG